MGSLLFDQSHGLFYYLTSHMVILLFDQSHGYFTI